MSGGATGLLRYYVLPGLGARSRGTIATVLAVAVVVAVFCSLWSLADGLRRALVVTADSNNLIVIAEGATAESNSALTNADAARLTAIGHLARGPDGRPLISPEVVVQASVFRRGDRSRAPASVAIRGVDFGPGLDVHAGTTLVAGRWCRPGRDELVVGRIASRRFEPGEIGEALDCGGRRFEIVGLFDAGGGAHDSEYWGHVSNVAAAYRRTMYSSAVLRLSSSEAGVANDAAREISSSVVALRKIRESDYYGAQTENARLVQGLALLVVVIMGCGAVFASMSAMHAALDGRVREIGMLRAMGFSRRSITLSLVGESTLVALTGGVIGCAVSAAFMLAGGTSDLVGTTTFTSVAFALRPSAEAVFASLAVAALIGVLGGVWPARWAARAPVVQTLRVA